MVAATEINRGCRTLQIPGLLDRPRNNMFKFDPFRGQDFTCWQYNIHKNKKATTVVLVMNASQVLV